MRRGVHREQDRQRDTGERERERERERKREGNAHMEIHILLLQRYTILLLLPYSIYVYTYTYYSNPRQDKTRQDKTNTLTAENCTQMENKLCAIFRTILLFGDGLGFRARVRARIRV